MIISLLKFVKQYIVISYKSIIKFIYNMFLLIVVSVLGLFNNLKSYLKNLYFIKNNQIIFILALPLIYDFNFVFTIFYYNYLLMFSSLLVYLVFSILNFAVLQDGSLLSQSLIHLQFLFDHFDQIIALLKNISPPNDPFVQDIEQDLVSIDTPTKDSNILLMKKEGPQQAMVQNSALYAGQPVEHVQAVNNAQNLQQLISALNGIRLDPKLSYQEKLGLLNHSRDVYTQHYDYLLNTHKFHRNDAIAAEAKTGLIFFNDFFPRFIASIPNRPVMPKL
jgi:hypothetical protein